MPAPMLLAALVFRPPEFGVLGALALAVGVAAVIFAYTAGLRAQAHAPPARFGLLTLRLTGVGLLLATLLHPACIREQAQPQRPVVAVVLDDSVSMAQPAKPGDEHAPSRYATARNVLEKQLMPALGSSQRVEVFDIEARALKPGALPATPTTPETPLTDTLLRVQRQLQATPLAAVVLLSDGAELTDAPPSGPLTELHVPVYPIEVCDAAAQHAGPPNIAIEAVSANQRVLVGNAARVTVDLAASGDTGRVPVTLSVLFGAQPVASTTLTWQPGDTRARAQLEFIPRRPGEFTYAVQVQPLAGETELSDNRATFPLAVRSKALTVLYLDGVLRWEGKYVREALSADPDLNLVTLVRTVPAGTDRGSQGALSAEQLARADVVILGDLEATFFSASEIEALRTWVLERGGALVLTGGYHSFGPEGFGRTPLRDVLPVEFSADANPQIEQAFSFKLTQAGQQHPIFSLTGDPVRDAAFYNALPPLDGCTRIAAIKPGALVLAVDPGVAGPQGNEGMPVMTLQRVGSGRTLVLSVDTTWRWRTVVGGFTGDSTFYQRFWSQLVRALVGYDDKLLRPLRVTTGRTRVGLGDTLTVDVELQMPPTTSQPAAPYRVTALALDEQGQQVSVPLTELGGGRYRGTLAARQSGRLDVQALAAPADRAAGAASYSDTTTVSVERPDREARDPRANPQWLGQVAQITGGRVLRPEDIAAWAQKLPADAIVTPRAVDAGWRLDYWAGGLCLVALCSEWILRRLSRLV